MEVGFCFHILSYRSFLEMASNPRGPKGCIIFGIRMMWFLYTSTTITLTASLETGHVIEIELETN